MVLLLLACTQRATADINTAEDALWLDELEQPGWISVTNMKQDSRDVSASVTVFTREDIERRQFRDLFDLLRSVPGMTVARKSAPTSTIDHASNTKYLGRGLEIEVNGIAQTMAAHSTAVMEFLPPIEIIDRVEVVRGSNAAADGGSRSFKGTIKITTRSAEFNDRPHLSLLGDSLDRHSAYAYYNNRHHRHHLSFSAHLYSERGFDKHTPENTATPAPVATRDDDTETRHYLLQYTTELSATSKLKLDASYMEGDFQTPGRTFSLNTIIPGLGDAAPQPESTISTLDYGWMSANFTRHYDSGSELVMRLSHQDWKWREDWPVCGPRGMLSDEAINFAQTHTDEFEALMSGNLRGLSASRELRLLALKLLQPGQSDTVCGHWPVSTDIQLTSARIQRTTTAIPNVKWLFGLEGNRISIEGETWDKNQYDTARAYTHMQWDYRNLVVNAGVSNERYSGRDAVSSRVGVNYHIDSDKTLRLAVAKGKKIPDAADLESGLGQLLLVSSQPINGRTEHFFYDGDDLEKNTEPQEVYNQEVGFAWRPSRRHTVDIRLFNDRYANISFYDVFLLKTPRSGRMDKKGAEFQYSVIDGLHRYGLSAHYHDSDASRPSEDYLSMGAGAYFTTYLYDRYDLSFNLYFNQYKVGNVNLTEERYNRDSTIFETHLGRKLTNNFHATLFYRFDNTHFLSNLYEPDLYTVDYENRHSLGVRLTLTF